MSEPTITDAPAEQSGSEPTQQAEQPKPTETVDFWKQKAREQEKRAKDNADAAKRLADIEESQKSEAQKVADRMKTLEEQLAGAQRDALRFKVASKFQIGDEDADLFLTGSDEETLTKQAERLVSRTDERRKQGNFVPREGASASPSEGASEEAAFARALFASGE